MANYTFHGIGHKPDDIKQLELRFGALRSGGLLNYVPDKFWEAQRVMRIALSSRRGTQNLFAAVRIGGVARTVTSLNMEADETSATTAAGQLPFNNITPSTVTFTHGGAANNITDDGNGLLVDSGTSTQRGTINYTTGEYSYTASNTKGLTTCTFTHTDYVDVPGASDESETSTNGAGSKTHTGTTAYPVVPTTFTAVDDSSGPSTCTVTDDGRGRLIQTLSAEKVVGTIDYKTGAISMSGLDTNIDTKLTYTYRRNVLGKTIAAGGAEVELNLLPGDDSVYGNFITDSPANLADGGDPMRHVKMTVAVEPVAADNYGELMAIVSYRGKDTFLLSSLNSLTRGIRTQAEAGNSV